MGDVRRLLPRPGALRDLRERPERVDRRTVPSRMRSHRAPRPLWPGRHVKSSASVSTVQAKEVCVLDQVRRRVIRACRQAGRRGSPSQLSKIAWGDDDVGVVERLVAGQPEARSSRSTGRREVNVALSPRMVSEWIEGWILRVPGRWPASADDSTGSPCRPSSLSSRARMSWPPGPRSFYGATQSYPNRAQGFHRGRDQRDAAACA